MYTQFPGRKRSEKDLKKTNFWIINKIESLIKCTVSIEKMDSEDSHGETEQATVDTNQDETDFSIENGTVVVTEDNKGGFVGMDDLE